MVIKRQVNNHIEAKRQDTQSSLKIKCIKCYVTYRYDKKRAI